ncbi:MAG: APC family permease [Calditrichaeota bacterium]|nr:APC family permease [Calditrichota bacterium]MCB9366728.1 APC family permease [Calditrichota bacterium]
MVRPSAPSTPPKQESEKLTLGKRIRRTLLGERRNPFDPAVFHSLSLVAFFAWVGLGADGISSANYGPEEAFLALHGVDFLAPILAIMIAATVWIISAAYMQVIEYFPTGGGGYLVASKLLSPKAGALAGSGLVIDYILTIAVSVVAGVDAVFSTLPTEYGVLRIEASIAVVVLLVVMNLRGLKESIMILLPIFLVFVVTHVGLVTFGFFIHLPDLPQRTAESLAHGQDVLAKEGWTYIAAALLTAFSMGAGTLTGIEAIANGMLTLKEPRVQTGKRTMIYMAASLSFLATMLLFNFFLWETPEVEDRTLNAVLFEQITGGWQAGGFHVGDILVTVMLFSAALLLFVAAQTGFIGGPRVLANMAEDSWLPHRFGHLSERLVTQNGILLMGGAAIGFILYAGGSITTLVSLYAINVFMDFSLAQAGMSRMWWSKRKEDPKWLSHFLICAVGLTVSVLLLIMMIGIKFTKGGWLVILITILFLLLCFKIRNHYKQVEDKVRELDDILGTLSLGESTVKAESLKPGEPTAVVLVQRFSGQGIHLLLSTQRLFGGRFKQFIFLSVGAIDTGRFKGVEELNSLQEEVQKETEKYVTLARSYGLRAEARTSCELDYMAEIERLCIEIHEEFPNTVFFAARLLFWKDTFWTRFLHNETPMTLQRRLMFHGLQFVVLPVRLQ